MTDGYEYYCDVEGTGRFEQLTSNLNDMARKGWRLAHAVSPTWRFAAPGDLLLIWERPLPGKRTP